jgi:hypothetical protein
MKRLLALGIVVAALASCADSPPPASPADDVASPDTLDVRCDGETTEVLTPTVQARTDGVHVRLTNTSDGELLYQHPGGGDGVDPGTTSIRLQILPGPSEFRCLRSTPDVDPGVEGGWASFEVLAPERWVSPQLDCPGAMYEGVSDYIEGAVGVEDPREDARNRFRLEGTVLEAGYSTSKRRTFVNVVDGSPKESFVYISDGAGGWLQSESSGCRD